jgi:hypothetical protein
MHLIKFEIAIVDWGHNVFMGKAFSYLKLLRLAGVVSVLLPRMNYSKTSLSLSRGAIVPW